MPQAGGPDRASGRRAGSCLRPAGRVVPQAGGPDLASGRRAGQAPANMDSQASFVEGLKTMFISFTASMVAVEATE